ncbi:MAG: peptide ABC transporter substrate-binding protein [Deltaproteobacteria bacterium]|nr:peptide ABC transporter substrate-binding protein [Deltaproteobacteria bacterium]
MQRMKIGFTRVTLFGITLLALMACSKKTESPKAGQTPGTQAQLAGAEGRILNFSNLAEPEYLDPGLASGNIEFNLSLSLFDGLVEYDPKDLHPIPSIAERWTLSPDGKVYTFYLRKDAKWSDGHSVTANDFSYSWERVLNPKTASKYAFVLYYVKNGEPYNAGKITDPKQLGLKVIDDTTFQVTLENPTPFFLEVMGYATFRPVPKWVVEKFGSSWTRPENIVTNGPFMLKSWVPQKEIVVMKNPTYWDAANVKLAGIRFNPVDDKETALKMYDSGQLDIDWELPTSKIQMLMPRPDFIQNPFLSTYFYRINVTKDPLKNMKLRQALGHAIDRDALSNQYLQKAEIPSASMIPAGIKGYTPAPGLEFNPELAKKLLAEAGFADPSQLPPITIHYNTDDRHKLVAQVVQQMWKKYLGINVGLLNEEWKSYLKTQNALNYQISRSGWIGDYPDPNTFLDMFTTTSTINQTGYSNPAYDALISEAARTSDQKKRFALLHQAEALLLNDAPVIPLYTYKKMMLVKPYVKGFYPNVQDLHPFKFVYME